MSVRVLGVDPGTAITGYGVVEAVPGRPGRLLECGVVRTDARRALATAGMLDGYYKHGRAAVGLAVNMVVLVGVGIFFFLRVFSQSVG